MIFSGSGTRMGLFKTISVVLILVLFFFGLLIRPVRIETEEGSSTLMLWGWQKGRIDFINSITARPVTIRFALPWRFSGFHAETDQGTEDYYTAGLYSWNDRLAKEHTSKINYCSEVGAALTLGENVVRTKGGCIKATLLWPPL